MLTLDNQASERTDRSTWDNTSNAVEEPIPDLDVGQGLPDLLLLESRLVGDTGPVFSKPFHGDHLLTICQELGGEDGVRHVEPEDNGPDQADDAKDNEKPLPGGNAGIDVTDAVGNKGLQDNRQTVTAVPCCDAERDLVLLVPSSCNEHVGWRDSTLGHAEEEARDHHAGEVVHACGAEKKNSPDEGESGNEAAEGKVCKETGGKWLEAQIAEVEDGP